MLSVRCNDNCIVGNGYLSFCDIMTIFFFSHRETSTGKNTEYVTKDIYKTAHDVLEKG